VFIANLLSDSLSRGYQRSFLHHELKSFNSYVSKPTLMHTLRQRISNLEYYTTQLGFLRAESADVMGEKRMEVVDMGTCVLE
jgi:hypothetical protein